LCPEQAITRRIKEKCIANLDKESLNTAISTYAFVDAAHLPQTDSLPLPQESWLSSAFWFFSREGLFGFSKIGVRTVT
jgi:hypothetical protein